MDFGGQIYINAEKPHSGNLSAWLGGYNEANDTLTQPISLPAASLSQQPIRTATLTYHWYVETDEFIHPWDYLTLNIRDEANNNLATLEFLNDGDATGDWSFSSFDVSDYIGQTIQIHFVATTDSAYKTSFFVDDVSLTTCE